MPYILSEDRPKFEEGLYKLQDISSPGELNYLVTRLALIYLNKKGLNYQTLNDISGALTNANLEFYRRVSAPYEDFKIASNGDVYLSRLEDYTNARGGTDNNFDYPPQCNSDGT